MSAIRDLLGKSSTRGGNTPSNSEDEVRADLSERRSSPRTSKYVPVFVYGYTAPDEPFHEQTNTLEVNANGGLLRLDANVHFGQKLLLMNRVTKEEQECYVVTLAKRPKRADRHVGVALAKPGRGFWGVRS